LDWPAASVVAATYAAVALTALAEAAAAAAAAATATLPASLSLLDRFKAPFTPAEADSRAAWEGDEGSCDADRERGRGLNMGVGMRGGAGDGEREDIGGEAEVPYNWELWHTWGCGRILLNRKTAETKKKGAPQRRW
jgi:hypothetical protein